MSALVLELSHQSWWERFRRGLDRPDDGAALVWERWTRARSLGAPDDEIPAELGLERGAALRSRQERLDPLLSEVREAFDEGAAALARYDFTLLLADAEGVVVRAGGGGAFAPVAQAVRLIEGASWGEAARGTNAIGTALAEGRPTAVVGAAHYARPFHELVCYAAPVRDPEGRVVAALDATSMVSQAHPAVWALVSATAQAMEATWRARAWARASAQVVGLVERTLDRVAEPALLGAAWADRALQRRREGGLWARAARPWTPSRPSGFTWETLRRAALGAARGVVVLPKLGDFGPWPGAPRAALWRGRRACLSIAVFREGAAPRLLSPPPAPKAARAARRLQRGLRGGSRHPRRGETSAAGWRRACCPSCSSPRPARAKERFAEALHAASKRRDGPFVAVNCGSFAPELLAAELFGYGPGAFTGADRQGREGLLHAAAGGTSVPRRDRRDAPGDAGGAPSSLGGRAFSACRASATPGRRTCGSSARPAAISRRSWPLAPSAKTSGIGSKGSCCACRRCAPVRIASALARFLLAQATRPSPPPSLEPRLGGAHPASPLAGQRAGAQVRVGGGLGAR
jgi:hypothetical protein